MGRVYHKVPSQEIKLDYGDGSNGLNVRFRGFEDTTIWNPTESVGKDIADMEAGGWASRDRLAVQPSANRQERYVCIEPGYVREFKTLKPGEEFLGQQVMRVL
jgi:glucose-6-phosphate 1-epimerase